MEMKNFSLAVQDASSLCRIKPFWTKVRVILRLKGLDVCIKALFSLTFNIQLHILGSLFKSHSVEESRPKWWSLPGVPNVCGAEARLDQSQTRGSEGKKKLFSNSPGLSMCFMDSWSATMFFVPQVLSELFSSVFENEEMPAPLHPLQGGLADRFIKPTALLRSLSPLTQRSGSSSQVSATQKSFFWWETQKQPCHKMSTFLLLGSIFSYFVRLMSLSRTQRSVWWMSRPPNCLLQVPVNLMPPQGTEAPRPSPASLLLYRCPLVASRGSTVKMDPRQRSILLLKCTNLVWELFSHERPIWPYYFSDRWTSYLHFLSQNLCMVYFK